MANSSSSAEREDSLVSKSDCEIIKILNTGSESAVFGSLMQLRKQHLKEASAIEKFRKNGGVQSLIKFIEKPKFADLALSILANNCLHILFRKEFIKQGGVPCLIRILQGLAPDSIQNRACRALTNVALDKHGAKIIHENKPLSYIVKFLTSTDNPDCQQTALRSLRILTDTLDHRRELCKLLGVLAIVKLLNSDVDAVVKSSVKALSFVTQKCSKECAEQVLEGEGPKSLISLSSHNAEEIKKHSVISLVNLSSQSCIKAELGKAGVIQLFVNHMNIHLTSQTNSSDSVGIIQALCFLAEEAVNRVRMRESGGLQTVTNILDDDSYYHIHKWVMRCILAFSYDDPSLELLLSLGLIEILAKLLRKCTEIEKCRFKPSLCQEEKGSLATSPDTDKNDSPTFSAVEQNSTNKSDICSPPNKEINTTSIPRDSNVKPGDNETAPDEGYLGSFPEELNDPVVQNASHTSKVFSINSPSYQEMRSCHFDVPYTQPSTLSPGREFPGSPQSFDSAYFSHLGNVSPSSNVSYMSSVFDDYLSEFSSEEEEDDANDNVQKTFPDDVADLKELYDNTTVLTTLRNDYFNIKNIIKRFSICIHGINPNEEERIESVIKDVLDEEKCDGCVSLFPCTQTAQEIHTKKSPLSGQKTLNHSNSPLYFGLSAAKKRLWDDEIYAASLSRTNVNNSLSSEKNKRKKHYTSNSLDDDLSALIPPDLPPSSYDQLTISISDDSEIIKEIKSNSLETFIIKFLNHLSYFELLVPKLAFESCILSVLKYFTEHPSPSPATGKLLVTISNSLMCFEKLISIGFVGMVLENCEREHFSRICDRCGDVDKLKNQLFANLRSIAESTFGTGSLLHIYHTGTDQEQKHFILAVPYIVRKMAVLVKLLVDIPGLELLTNLLQNKEDNFYLKALHSLLILCQTLLEHNSFWKIPETSSVVHFPKKNVSPKKCTGGTSVQHGTKEKSVSDPKNTDVSQVNCKYISSSGQFDIWFILDDGCTVGVNKLQLCDNSDYFSAMLDGYFVESTQSQLKIPDISKEALVIVFHYLYGCYQEACHILQKVSLDLLLELINICDRFLLNDFHKIILPKIVKNLTPNTVQTIYFHSKKYHVSELKVAVLNYLFGGTVRKVVCLSILDDLFHSDYQSEILSDIINIVKTNLTIGCVSNFAFNTA